MGIPLKSIVALAVSIAADASRDIWVPILRTPRSLAAGDTDDFNKPTPGTQVTVSGIVEYVTKVIKVGTEDVRVQAKITFLSDVVMGTGDLLVLPNGQTGSILMIGDALARDDGAFMKVVWMG